MHGTKPKHIAVIMDGNGRWAGERSLPRTAGHKKGLQRVRSLVASCIDHEVQALTLFAFSTENWHRPAEEVGYLFNLFLLMLRTEVKKLHKK